VSIDQRKLLDFVGIRRSDGLCTLTISDHLSWDDPDHISQLQGKLNDYLAFVESGEIYDSYPDSRGRQIEIQVICKYMPPADDALPFLDHAAKKIRAAGIGFSVCHLSEIEHDVA
jgi:hypothetical protein